MVSWGPSLRRLLACCSTTHAEAPDVQSHRHSHGWYNRLGAPNRARCQIEVFSKRLGGSGTPQREQHSSAGRAQDLPSCAGRLPAPHCIARTGKGSCTTYDEICKLHVVCMSTSLLILHACAALCKVASPGTATTVILQNHAVWQGLE